MPNETGGRRNGVVPRSRRIAQLVDAVTALRGVLSSENVPAGSPNRLLNSQLQVAQHSPNNDSNPTNHCNLDVSPESLNNNNRKPNGGMMAPSTEDPKAADVQCNEGMNGWKKAELEGDRTLAKRMESHSGESVEEAMDVSANREAPRSPRNCPSASSEGSSNGSGNERYRAGPNTGPNTIHFFSRSLPPNHLRPSNPIETDAPQSPVIIAAIKP
ncbi:unnamed protein product [Caenorhabditis sp. 36 PRJEB53466]|nr:unnamed protein product [Caenorhabditis sp. 36 PRJEB53466]